MKFAHITDIHIRFDEPGKSAETFRKLLQSARKNDCWHILLTGDISDYSDSRDYELTREILKEYDYLSSDKLSLVPGNHDIYGPGKDVKIFEYPLECKNLDYNEAVKNFTNAFSESFDGAETDESKFPYLKFVNDTAIIGINSIDTWSLSRNPLGTNGYVNDDDFLKTKELLEKASAAGKPIFVLIHHQLNDPDINIGIPEHSLWLAAENYKMKMHERERLIELFRDNNVSIIMHGHTHITDQNNFEGCIYLNSSGCSIPFTKNGYRSYHIISAGKNGDKPEIKTAEI